MTGLIDDITRWLGHTAASTRPEHFTLRHRTANGTTIEIRTGTPGDTTAVVPMIERICTLHRKWDVAKFGFIDGAVAMYRNWLAQRANDPRSVFIVAAVDHRLVAFLIGTTEDAAPIFHPATYGLIRDLWVDDDWRRHGIGQQLVHAAINQFHAGGVSQIRLETAAANDTARRFFASCGFRASAVEMLIE